MIPDYKIQTVIQGEVVCSRERDILFSTVLGSCISVCMFDTSSRIGGINHFLLPGSGGKISIGTTRFMYGQDAIDVLLKRLVKLGANREFLIAKAFGGASVLSLSGNIGAGNINFTRSYLEHIGINCVGYSMGGTKTRNIRFNPSTGDVYQMFI